MEKSIEGEKEEGGTNASSTNVDASDDKSKGNDNVEGKDRGVEDEQRTKNQHDRPILEEKTSHTVESSPTNPSPDTSLVKSIKYLDYNYETMVDKYSNLTDVVTVKAGLGKSFSKFRKILEDILFQMNVVYQLLLCQIYRKRTEKV